MSDYGYDLSKVWVIINRTPIENRYASIDCKIASDDRCLFRPDLINGGLIRRPLPIGAKGQTLKIPIPLSDDLMVAIAAKPTEKKGGRGKAVLADIDPQYDFEYLKISGSILITRPTSRSYYQVNLQNSAMLTRIEPDWIKSMIELHRGHGPTLLKDFQKVMALGLLLIVLSGLWLGLTSSALRPSTLITSSAGLIAFLVLAFLSCPPFQGRPQASVIAAAKLFASSSR